MRLDAIVGGLVRDLECELQGIACAQDDGVWTVLEGNTVRIVQFSMGERNTGEVAYASERSLAPLGPTTVNLGD